MSEQLRESLAAQAKVVTDLVNSGQYADAFAATQELQRGLRQAELSVLDRIKTGLRDLLEIK